MLEKKSERSAYIDAFRGMAILGVLFHHFFYRQISASYPFATTQFYGFSLNAFNHGHLGVDLFFILSGMVFYRPHSMDTWSNVFRFYRQRALRLWPLYIVTIMLVACLNRFGQFDLFTLLKSLFLLPTGLHNLIPKYWEPGWVLWVFWSLGVEILFSLFLPALLLLENRFGLTRLVCAAALLCFLYRAAADYMWFATHPNYLNFFINPVKDNIFGRLDEFLFGMAAMCVARRDIAVRPAYGWVALGGMILVGNAWSYLDGTPRGWPQSVLASANHIIFAVCCVTVLLSARRSAIWNSTILKPILFMGTVCYSAYIIHALLLQNFDWPKGLDVQTFLAFGLFLFCTFLLSAIAFATIEAIGIRDLPRWASWVHFYRKDCLPLSVSLNESSSQPKRIPPASAALCSLRGGPRI